MKSTRSGLSARGAQVAKNVRPTPDSKIDFSDIPELTTKQLRSMKRVGRPLMHDAPKKAIALRLDPKVLQQFRRLAEKVGKGYQVLMNEVLARYAARHAG